MNGLLELLGLASIGYALWRLISRAVAEFAVNYRLKDVIENRDPWELFAESNTGPFNPPRQVSTVRIRRPLFDFEEDG